MLQKCMREQMDALTAMYSDKNLKNLDDQFKFLLQNFCASMDVKKTEEHKFNELKSIFEGAILQTHYTYFVDGGVKKMGWKNSPMKILVEIEVEGT